MVDADHVANRSRVEDSLEQLRVPRVPHHMRDGGHNAGALDRVDNPQAAGLGRGHRLLDQQGVAALGEGDDRLDMLEIGGRDHDRVGHAILGQCLAPVAEPQPSIDLMTFCQPLPVCGSRLRDSYDLGQRGVTECVVGKRRASRASPDDEERHRLGTAPPRAGFGWTRCGHSPVRKIGQPTSVSHSSVSVVSM